MELLDEIINMLNSGKFQEVLDSVDDFLEKNPKYKTIDYYHFANPIEEILFDIYVEKIQTVKTLGLDEALEEIYSIYAIALMNLGKLDEAEKYLKIANQINPVSAPILMRLCELYQAKHEEEKLKELTCDIFRYAYDVKILISNYFKLADYFFHTNQNNELYNHLLNFFMFLKTGEEQNPVKSDLDYFKKNNIQIGVNTEIIKILMYLIDVYTKQNMLNSAEYFKNIFKEVTEFTEYLNNL
jgi:tetratricopeptide (TPR) repeat protein